MAFQTGLKLSLNPFLLSTVPSHLLRPGLQGASDPGHSRHQRRDHLHLHLHLLLPA